MLAICTDSLCPPSRGHRPRLPESHAASPITHRAQALGRGTISHGRGSDAGWSGKEESNRKGKGDPQDAVEERAVAQWKEGMDGRLF